MRLYRITKQKYLTSYSGQGKSFQDGARWNSPGLPVLYFASSPAVALLEMANYLPSPRLIPKDYNLGIYDLPSNTKTKTLTIDDLPDDWADFPYPLSTQLIGSNWLNSNQELCLIVPSAAIPEGMENIVIVNPNHPQIGDLQLTSTTPNLYNKRAFQGI
ncbi:MAG: RES family NAD+ phosphorylase [Pleurocapsa sp. SU_5_0]|nr:RES family NAD+ phosphorylase [Pleurocapsa sp. SU_5_0]NJO95477.1 RES family NAD+ phosphorylase [Pleurocapsa sp. CRU_1_2]NJR46868.1 RES family NAD+ phosphorylase [Hyellaceae cyanobacterium CSU_1_1]